ncbi:MAG: hypothetical protein ACREC9_16480 [Methylocella sp.]
MAAGCRAILAFAFALAPRLAGARAEESLSGVLIEGYWVEVQQRVDRSFPNTQNNRLSLFVVDPRRYTVEMVRNWDKSGDRPYTIEGAGAFGAVEVYSRGPKEAYSRGPKVRVTRDEPRFTVTTYLKNFKYVVILDVHEKSCSADVSFQLDAGQKDYLMRGIRSGVLQRNEWYRLSSIMIRNASCRVRDMNMG